MNLRITYSIAAALITSLLITSIYLQYVEGFIPCPLCILQRFSLAILGFLFLIGIFTYKNFIMRIVVNTLSLFFSIIGIVLAARQIYLQNFPHADSSGCGVSIKYMLEVLPISEVAQKIFAGSTECAQRGWEVLYLNMAEWTLIWFIGFLILSLCLVVEEFI